MNCEEFLRQFRDALDGKVSESVIQENVRYYRSYINNQTADGKSESDVLGMLGDPRLLAKTIEESCRFASGKDGQGGYAGGFGSSYASSGNTSYYRNDYENYYGNNSASGSAERGYTETSDDRRARMPGWLITCIVLVVVLVVLSVVFRVFVVLTPYILVFLLAGFLIRAIRSWWQRK